MSRKFHSVSIAEFNRFVKGFKFSRRITEVHLHHTWRPTKKNYNEHDTILGMWRYHTQTRGWSDIGQHVTVAPDGMIWLCRNFNWSPASAKGFNGNSSAGPFMIEIIGDFDHGREELVGDQKRSVLAVIKCIQKNDNLRASNLRFHREMSTKTCPGQTLDKAQLITEIEQFSFSNEEARTDRSAPYPPSASRVGELIETMKPDTPQTDSDDMSDAEHSAEYEPMSDFSGAERGVDPINDAMLDRLADHAILLNNGRFSQSNKLDTTKGDVDRIFNVLIPREIEVAKHENRKAKILFYAHGGLVKEVRALKIAAKQVDYWQSNNIYPVFFIWKTGLAETLKNLVQNANNKTAAGSRGLIGDITDEAVEELSRVIGGDTIWAGMKDNARIANEGSGGGEYIAGKIAELAAQHPDDMEIHTVGHSAGSIFNAHFMKSIINKGGSVKSAHFLAPAISRKDFNKHVAPFLGNSIGHLTLFTMIKRLEKADTVAGIYRKSLLYLIYGALEDKRNTDVLGLELSLRGNRKLTKLFGLGKKLSKKAEVVWSPSNDIASGSASQSKSHGGFDDDPATMQSVARRILNNRGGEPLPPFPENGNRGPGGSDGPGGDYWRDQFDFPSNLEYLQQQSTSDLSSSPTLDSQTNSDTPSSIPSGNRKALCIGINAYKESPLNGCVNDAKLWQKTLEGLGYQTRLMKDDEATGANILSAIDDLITSSSRGDNLVIQFAGHGTQFRDLSGDEQYGDTPGFDECLCAVDSDFKEDGLVIDDDLRRSIDQLPDQVQLTCFFDCCHSGTATRAAQLRNRASGSANRTARRLIATPEMEALYQKKIARMRGARSTVSGIQKEVLFSACRSSELAYEKNGQGDFTRIATQVLSNRVGSLSNVDFLESVIQKFGNDRAQTPEIDCEARLREQPLLGS